MPSSSCSMPRLSSDGWETQVCNGRTTHTVVWVKLCCASSTAVADRAIIIHVGRRNATQQARAGLILGSTARINIQWLRVVKTAPFFLYFGNNYVKCLPKPVFSKSRLVNLSKLNCLAVWQWQSKLVQIRVHNHLPNTLNLIITLILAVTLLLNSTR